jgi:hypothetical protein
MSLLDVMLANAGAWLWETQTQVELFRALPEVWRGLADDNRARLVNAIVSGPSRESFSTSLSDDDWTELRDHLVWSRLVRIANIPPALPAPGETALREITSRHPDWTLTGDEQEDFPTWIEVGWGAPSDYTTDSLSSLGDDELIQVLRTEKRNREGLLDRWSKTVTSDVARAVRLLRVLVANDAFEVDIWSATFRGLRPEANTDVVRTELVTLLATVPEPLLTNTIHHVADILKEMAEAVPEASRAAILGLWDRLLPISLTIPRTMDGDILTTALNHPMGRLAEAILDVLRSRELARGEGLSQDIQDRLNGLVEAPGEQGRFGRAIIASRLPVLHYVDTNWTRHRLIPLFDWANVDEARGAWAGFLWSPSVRPSLWDALKQHFLSTFDHLDNIGEGARNLATLLASVAIDGEDALTAQEARDCLRKLAPEGRSSVAWWLERKLEDAGDKAPSLWRERIGPWLAAAWPQEPALRSDSISTRLAGVAVFSKDAFPQAVPVVVNLVGHITRAWGLLKKLSEYRHSTRYPMATLDLLNAVTPDNPAHWFGNLSAVLNEIRVADPQLDQDQRFTRLNEIATRNRLNG